jgi:hypothetical protein
VRIIVSGYRRCGTSAMMKSLIAGLSGFKAGYRTESDARFGNLYLDGYIPNPSPLFEIGSRNYLKASFLREMPENAIVKIFFDGLIALPSGDYLIIFMERDPLEITSSAKRVDQHLDKLGGRTVPIVEAPFDVYRDYNQEDIDHVKGIMRERRDVRLLEVDFRELVEDPIAVFNKIKYTPIGRERLDLDVERAASFIKPEFYRERIENVITG